jgi:SM-20-related protein
MAAEVLQHGVSVYPGALSGLLTGALRAEADGLWDEDAFRFARVGAGRDKRLSPETRSDRVCWWGQEEPSEPQRAYMAILEMLRMEINQRAFLGLFDWEGHYAVYLAGTFYRRHLDVFARAPHRQITVIAYLNQEWRPGDGGELRLYLDPEDPQRFVDVPPLGGTLVAFASARFYHEVLMSQAPRHSVTGWFCARR